MKKFPFLLLGTFFFCYVSYAQFSKYIVRFKDKTGTPYSINNPSQFLSSKAILRRTRQHIVLDETDLPITPRYIDSIRLSGAVVILNSSKWLNQVCIQTSDAAALVKINSFSFVLATAPVRRVAAGARQVEIKFKETVDSIQSPRASLSTADYYNYGSAYPQIHIHEGEFLHNNGFRGEGMSIAILDAGFFHYQTVTAFDSARNNNQIIETYDFVNNEVSVNEDDSHGMHCFSIMAANWPGQLVGSSPKANYYLYRTEDANSEYPIEEQNWAAAAERVDSLGIDVISSSLGYTTFDNSLFDHSYADMNGHTTVAAKAAGFAAKKGIIVLVAAGNDGTDSWHFIGTPADADSIISVGAVSSAGQVGSFSSYGPSSDGRVEPVVASVGVSTLFAGSNNALSSGNGTSYATPNLAGLVTCLWQAFPEFTNMEIIEAIKRSCPTYSTPDNRVGYGIPNFHKAFDDFTQQRALRNLAVIPGNDWIKVYPNPFGDNFTLSFRAQLTGNVNLSIFDAAGKLYWEKTLSAQENQVQFITVKGLPVMARGIYTLHFTDGKNKRSIKLFCNK